MKLFKRKPKRISRNEIINPNAIKALREVSREAMKAAMRLRAVQTAMTRVNEVINNVVWKKIENEIPEAKSDTTQSIDVLCLSEKKIRVVASIDLCVREWNTSLKITHWTHLPKDP